MLEPACGTGRFLLNLPAAGYRVTGYDLSRQMVAYARRRIRAAGLASRSRAVRADMRTAVLPGRFDAAINSINSIGYLLSDSDFTSHLHTTARNLKPDSVYILHLSTAYRRLPAPDPGWTLERDGVRVHTTWNVVSQDRERKFSHQVCRMRINDHGRRFSVTDRHTLRLWTAADLKALVRASGLFRFAAIYADDYRRVRLSAPVTGEDGNHYFVLKRV